MSVHADAGVASGRLITEAETVALAQTVAQAVAQSLAAGDGPFWLALDGQLGAGKSFFARALLRAYGVEGIIRSPTYTLIEPYQCQLGCVLHLDLYRLADPEEVIYLGLQEQAQEAALVMVEWPEKAAGFLETFDATLRLKVLPDTREWQLTAHSLAGQRLLATMLTK